MTGKAPGAHGAPRHKAFVIGAGLAGLSAATLLAARGASVTLFEASPQAGGRCRSYFDPAMDGVIDNGNHLVLSGNRAVRDYLVRIGARDALAGPDKTVFDFVDLKSGARWTLHPNDGPLPWWVGSKSRRVPGTAAFDYAAYARLLWAGKDKSIGQVLGCNGDVWERLIHPFFLAALNVQPKEGSARLAAAIMRETLLKGGQAWRPRVAVPTLAAAFVDPALNYLEKHGAGLRLGTRLRGITLDGRNAIALDTADTTLPVGPRDAVILAVPPWVAKDLMPELTVPEDFCSIVNAHFRMPPPPGAPQILVVLGGTAEWIFTFHDRISVTVSGADAIVDQDRESLAVRIWADVAKALKIEAPMPAWQIVKEKRATFAATPAQDARRPAARTRLHNLFLAGDWTRTGLPATIEGALRSGESAAALALRHLSL